jgi:uncharacterized RDD family membrane protein YckC
LLFDHRFALQREGVHMFCSKCGANVSEGAAFCPSCGAPVASAPAAQPAPPAAPAPQPQYVQPQYTPAPAAAYPATTPQPTVAYAGFWLRFVAFIIDAIILGIVGTLITLPFMVPFGLRGVLSGRGPMSPEDFFPLMGGLMRVALVRTALNYLYYALLECSAWQGTIGKKALGLYVTDMTGHRISFGRATGRFFGKIISSLILLIGFIMAGFTEKKQALHDMMAGCLVLRKL